MNELNSVLIEGTLLDEPKRILLADTEESVRLVKFDIASHKVYRNSDGETKDDVLIISCIAFGELAERIQPLLKSGMQVRVLGRLRSTRWQTREGEDRKSFEIVAQHIEFRRRKKGKKTEEEISLSDDEKANEKVSENVFRYEFY